jgi:hypothetical protein
MKSDNWVVVAKVGPSRAAQRTDSCGDMEQLELMELILVSEHATKVAAQEDAAVRRASKDGWRYAVMTRRNYDRQAEPPAPKAA